MSTQVEISVPHIFEVGGRRYTATDLDMRVELVHDHDGWAIGDVDAHLMADDGKWRWVTLPKDDPKRVDALSYGYGLGRHILEEAWNDYATDGGWKARRYA
ncbi:MAG TPA: hypothetical protein PLN31_20470 [Azoarcus taiwanensis]|nr:hypothetical protein [Azoarcus taiwanensis]